MSKSESGKGQSLPKSSFRVKKVGAYKERGRGNTKILEGCGRTKPLCQDFAPQLLSIRYSVSMAFLGLAPRKTHQESKKRSALYSSDRTVCAGNARERFYRTGSSVSPVFGSKERFYRTSNGSQSFSPKSVHPKSNIQDDNSQDHPSGPRSRVFGGHFGSQGCALACSDKRIILELPGISGRMLGISLLGYTTNAQDTLIAIYLDNKTCSLTHAYPNLRGCEALRMFRTGMRIG